MFCLVLLSVPTSEGNNPAEDQAHVISDSTRLLGTIEVMSQQAPTGSWLPLAFLQDGMPGKNNIITVLVYHHAGTCMHGDSGTTARKVKSVAACL